MNQLNEVIPRGGHVEGAVPPADKQEVRASEQAPLGPEPSYDDVLDTAVDYTFPCSDPIAPGCCDKFTRPVAEP